jgi:alpha-D-xyloside xylohydrolase
MYKRYFSFLALVLLALTASGQEVVKTSNGIKTGVGGNNIEVSYYNASSVRILKAPQGTKPFVDPYAVIAKPAAAKVVTGSDASTITVACGNLVTTINKNDGSVTVSRSNGTVLSKEKADAKFSSFDDSGRASLSSHQSFTLGDDEQIYGLGIRQNGKMSQRGTTQLLLQGNLEDAIPIVTSSKGYALFYDNLSPLNFKSEGNDMSFDAEVGECIDYYVLDGGAQGVDGAISQIRSLTGKAPMLSLWTYGFWQSRERYKSFDEVKDVVNHYRNLRIPLDGIIQDWQYWGSNYTWNAMECLADGYFNEPAKNIQDVHKMNAHIIFSVWESFGPMTKQYAALDSIGAIFHDFQTWPQSSMPQWPPRLDYPSGVRVFDVYNPKARDIFWKYLKKGLYDIDIDGFWMDSTEPDVMSGQGGEMNQQTFMGSFRKVRNAFPLCTLEASVNHMKADNPNKRAFILTRSVFAGQQRTGADTWSGDTQASWPTFVKQIVAGLNFTLCGNPQYNSDIAGFFRNKFDGENDKTYRELYVRWMQYGAFTPLMRSHGTDFPREIYHYGKAGEPTYDALVKAVKMRYTLLPYTYSTSWQVSKYNGSFMRAFVFDFPEDKNAIDINDEYMYGKAFLVAPIVTPSGDMTNKNDYKEGQATTRKVYLPKGATWYDYWTNKTYDGGQSVDKTAAYDIIPLYVRAGSIIPLGPDVQYAAEKAWDNLKIKVYPGADGSFTLYEDEGDNYNYEKGAYSEIPFSWNEKQQTLTIGERKGTFKGMLLSRKFTIVMPNGTAKTVEYKGKKVTCKNL